MIKKHFLFLFLILSTGLFSWAQNSKPKKFFDKNGKSTNDVQSYYFRTTTDTAGFYRSFYSTNNKVYFEGKMSFASETDENLNVYVGTCSWYYKNGNKKSIRTFKEGGAEEGVSKYYYETGRPWKEIDYVGGKMKDNCYVEYNEDGQVNRIFEEDFVDNRNDWDLYISDKSTASIKSGTFELTSASKEGTSRYISFPIKSSDYAMEAIVFTKALKDKDKAGIIFGFKDWQNYNYFVVTHSSIYIGSVYEGVNAAGMEGMFSSALSEDGKNVLKIISNGEKNFYSVNGEVQYSDERTKLFGSYFGFIVSGKTTLSVDKFILKEMDYKSSNVISEGTDANVKATGSGIIIHPSGYIVTNHHVIDNAGKVLVEVYGESGKKTYNAKVIQKDVDNDLAIIKITDESFQTLPSLKYAFKENGSLDVGASVFTIGFPYALSGMGKEAKFTDGKVSAKTGYNSAVNSFQTSIPVQPGNSGGPVFNEKGQLVGVINAAINNADNVSYAIKLNYINNIVELLPDKVDLPNYSQISTLSLEEKIKILTNYVVLIKIK